MKNKLYQIIFLVVLPVLALGLMGFAPAPPVVQPIQEPEGDQFVLGENYTLDEGDTLNGNLFVMGGNADLQEGSTVTGDVVLMGGNLLANGEIDGDVTAIGGLVTLGDTAVVAGDVNVMSTNLLRDEGAEIHGDVNTDLRFPFAFGAPSSIPIPEIPGVPELPGNIPVRPEIATPGALEMGMNLVGSFLWWLGRSFIWAFLALIALLFWPRPIQRITNAAMAEPVASGGLGLLTAIIAPLVLVAIALTICGIPFSLIGFLALAIAWALGIIALGLETGARLERMVHQDWAPPVQGAVGTFLLTLVINAIGALVICVGWLVPFIIGIVGLGAAILTRLGSRDYPLASAAIVSVPPAYVPPVQPGEMEGERFDENGIPPAM